MAQPILQPVFIKGRLTLVCGKYRLEFTRKNVSIFGISGLPWGPLSAQEHFGKPVDLKVEIASLDHYGFTTTGYIMREYTLYSEHMAIRLRLDPETQREVRARIQKHGFFPTDYIRKYPRIPSNPKIQSFPLNVIAQIDGHADPIVFGLRDISPNGVLISTENQASLRLKPGDRIQIALDPRGWFPAQIRCQAMVCRVSDDLEPGSGNLTRYLGVRFTKIDDMNRAAFLDLMKDILQRLQQLSAQDPQGTAEATEPSGPLEPVG
jgi:hypothetical protein